MKNNKSKELMQKFSICSAGIDYRIFCDEPQFLEPQKYYQYCSAAGGSDHSGVW